MKTLAATVLLAALAHAQTFVVDANLGPGTNFTEISAAVAAVPDGAVLDVRPGNYQKFRIVAKSLTVLCRPGARVFVSIFDPTAIDIVDLASHQTVVLRGIEMAASLGLPRLVCRDCDGTVVIDDCAAIASPTNPSGGQIIVSGCGHVFVRDTRVATTGFTSAALESFHSNLVLDGCTLRSEAFCIRQGGGRVVVTDCRLESGAVAAVLAPPLLYLAGGELALNGATELVGGAFPVLAGAGVGTVVVDPSTVMQNLTTPEFDPNLTRDNRAMPQLAASTQGLGGAASATLAVPAGGTGYLFVGFPADPAAIAGIADPTWLAPTPVLDASGGAPSVTGGYPVPNAPWVLGVAIAWQGAVVSQSAAIAFSNPAGYGHY